MAKRYYWLKLKEDFFDDDTISYLEEQENGILYVNFYLKLCLKSLKTDGKLIRLVGERLIPYDVNSLAKLTGTPVDTVRVAMTIFENIGLVKIMETGEIYLSQLEEMIGKETDKASMMRRKRAEEKICGNNVTEALLNCYTEKEKEKEKEKEQEQEQEKEKEQKNDAIASVGGKKTKTAKKQKTAYYPLDEVLNQAVLDFIEFRKNIKSPMTDRAVKLLIDRLDKMTTDNNEKIEILNQSIMNGWKGVYLIDRGKQSSGQNRIDEYQRVMQKFAEEEASGQEENMWDSLFK